MTKPARIKAQERQLLPDLAAGTVTHLPSGVAWWMVPLDARAAALADGVEAAMRQAQAAQQARQVLAFARAKRDAGAVAFWEPQAAGLAAHAALAVQAASAALLAGLPADVQARMQADQYASCGLARVPAQHRDKRVAGSASNPLGCRVWLGVAQQQALEILRTDLVLRHGPNTDQLADMLAAQNNRAMTCWSHAARRAQAAG
jgi:hypothetical protein